MKMNNLDTRSILNTYAEGQRYFMGEGQINNALTRLVADLKEHEIDYVVIGAIALMAYVQRGSRNDIEELI